MKKYLGYILVIGLLCGCAYRTESVTTEEPSSEIFVSKEFESEIDEKLMYRFVESRSFQNGWLIDYSRKLGTKEDYVRFFEMDTEILQILNYSEYSWDFKTHAPTQEDLASTYAFIRSTMLEEYLGGTIENLRCESNEQFIEIINANCGQEAPNIIGEFQDFCGRIEDCLIIDEFTFVDEYKNVYTALSRDELKELFK